MKRLLAISLLTALAVAAVACGVPSSSKFASIDRSNIPFGLSETTSTTVVTTSSTIALESTTTLFEPATTIATEPVQLFFVIGAQIVPVSQYLVRPVSIAQTMSALEAGPPREFGVGIRTAIPVGSQTRVNESGGVATVDLQPAFFADMEPRDQRLAIAQIVLTLTNQRGVGQVTFTQNGAPISVLSGSGSATQPGALLVGTDYAGLLSNSAITNSTPTTQPEAPPTATTAGP